MTAHYFSNGTESYAWQANWCERCARDNFQSCPLLRDFYLGLEVPQWFVKEPDELGRISLGDNITCIDFKPRGP
jgi:hypothetical protein